jgi:orotate phosphoribosyltransferase
MSLRRGFEVKSGERILIVEDVITTGKSFGECAAVLERNGAEIAAIACIVDRRGDDTETPWPLYAACKVTAQTWKESSCDLCRQKIPVVKPGSRKII